MTVLGSFGVSSDEVPADLDSFSSHSNYSSYRRLAWEDDLFKSKGWYPLVDVWQATPDLVCGTKLTGSSTEAIWSIEDLVTLPSTKEVHASEAARNNNSGEDKDKAREQQAPYAVKVRRLCKYIWICSTSTKNCMKKLEAGSEQQKKRKAQVQFEAQFYTNEDWDLIRAKLEANAELSRSMLGSEL
ncbi:hypothetical protein Tco_0383263 [Tanacetum coccineum]